MVKIKSSPSKRRCLQGKGVVAKAIVGCKIWFPHGSVGLIPTTRTNCERYMVIAEFGGIVTSAPSQPCQGRGRGFKSLRPLQFFVYNQDLVRCWEGAVRLHRLLAPQCKRFVSSRILKGTVGASALRRHMGHEAPEPNYSGERPGKPGQRYAAAAPRHGNLTKPREQLLRILQLPNQRDSIGGYHQCHLSLRHIHFASMFAHRAKLKESARLSLPKI